MLLFRRLCRGPKWPGDLNSTTGSGMRMHWLMQKKAAANLATKLTEITLQLEAERALRVEAEASLKLEKSKNFPVKTVSSRHHRSQDSAGAAAGNSAGVGVGSSSERDGAPPKKKYRRQLPSSSSSSSSVSQCRCGNRRVSTWMGTQRTHVGNSKRDSKKLLITSYLSGTHMEKVDRWCCAGPFGHQNDSIERMLDAADFVRAGRLI